MDHSRRIFLTTAVAAGAMKSALGGPQPDTAEDATSDGSKVLTPGAIRLGIATYSFREFGRKAMLAMTRNAGTRYLNLKDVHLALNTKPEDMKKARAEFEKAGKIIVGGGTISFPKVDADDFRKKFEYAKQAGMPLIVAAPTHETLPKLEPFVKEFDIKIAVHNHGPEDKHFPTPSSVLDAVKNLDPRMGWCMDCGHSARTGADLPAVIRAAGPRLLDMHIKDLKSVTAKDSQVVVGEGVLPIADIFRALHDIKYLGFVNLEYEIDDIDPLPGVMKSIAYMHGLVKGLGLPS